LAFTDRTAEIINDCPFGVCEVEFNAVIWAPKVGQRLCMYLVTATTSYLTRTAGTHSLSSPSHLSLLFGKTFNISIPLQHIPDDIYEFDYSAGDAQSADESDDDDSDAGEDNHVHEVGRWRDRRTGKLVGQDDGDKLKFTVIGSVSYLSACDRYDELTFS
jgi:DNA-directed RNA polymerase I subunit RPA43